MLGFLLGISLTFNFIFLVVFFLFLKIKDDKEFLNGNYIDDIEVAKDFFSDN